MPSLRILLDGNIGHDINIYYRLRERTHPTYSARYIISWRACCPSATRQSSLHLPAPSRLYRPPATAMSRLTPPAPAGSPQRAQKSRPFLWKRVKWGKRWKTGAFRYSSVGQNEKVEKKRNVQVLHLIC